MRNVTKQIKKIHCLILLLLLSCLPTLARNGIVTKETTGYEKGKTATGAYYTDKYRNLFNEYLGISQQQTNLKIEQIWHHFFVNEKTKVYYECNDNTVYIYDTGNRDVRTEGMSYGMMICVQLNKQAEFDKLWRWAKKHMLYTSGKWSGYYAWHCTPELK